MASTLSDKRGAELKKYVTPSHFSAESLRRVSLEGVLATQMVATHNAAMQCLLRAATADQPLQAVDMYFRNAAKLLSTYARQMELLDKRRGKGQQVSVKYVNVEAGAQAIVGNIENRAANV